mmetsp:Transcript_33006/g.37877  ORF Transcript_33006/g.37877 Transcript_33006/m.37877 type:complete len:105 (+) Transcript_33006:316-630(+)
MARAVKFYLREEELDGCKGLNELWNEDEARMREKVRKGKSVPDAVLGWMTVEDAVKFGIHFEVMTFEKLSAVFKEKTVQKYGEYVRTLEMFMNAIGVHEYDLES